MTHVDKFRKKIRFADYRLFCAPDAAARPGEIDLAAGIRLSGAAGTENQRRELARFCEVSGIPLSGGYPVRLEISPETEGRRIAVEGQGCLISGSCEDELWRAVFQWCDLLRSVGRKALVPGERRGKLWLKYRLARCPWGPTHRAPDWKDELTDNIDYYPEDFLRQLAWEGVNGLWITGTWRELADTGFEPVDPLRSRRLAKLRRTVEKCGKFGIKVWLFCIEPFNFTPDDPLPERHPELRGAPYFHRYAFCPSGEEGQTFIRNAVRSIFSAVPGLGGMLNISHGERGTTCLSSISCLSNAPVKCPRCGRLPKAQILCNALAAMRRGMDEVGACDAGLISWLYMPSPSPRRAPWVFDIPSRMPERTVLQYNFESGGQLVQLGKTRTAGDYHLSYTGPAATFRRIARSAARAGVPLSAKVQVSASIEAETLDCVPVPGILYDKYKAMRRYGVSSVMQSWIFGSKPGLMTRAAGLLASEDFSGSRRDFLLRLAAPEWGEKAAVVARAWAYFSRAYRNFPFCNMFQYYGPLDDAASWPLYPKMAYIPLTPVWKVDFPLSGDAIGECLENHTIEEAVSLMEKCDKLWRRGMKCLEKAAGNLTPVQEMQLVNIRAMAAQIGICIDVLRFYKLRSVGTGEAVREMKSIVLREIALRRELLACIKKNPGLGFQSEACAFKYDPVSIRRAAASLEGLLKKDFPELEKHPEKIRIPLPEYDCAAGAWETSATFRWRLAKEKNGFRFWLENLRPSRNPSFSFAFVDRMLIRSVRSTRVDRGGIFSDLLGVREFAFDGRGGFSLLIPPDAAGFLPGDEPAFGVFRVEDAIEDDRPCESSPPSIHPDYVPRLRLKLGYFDPGAVFLLKNY